MTEIVKTEILDTDPPAGTQERQRDVVRGNVLAGRKYGVRGVSSTQRIENQARQLIQVEVLLPPPLELLSLERVIQNCNALLASGKVLSRKATITALRLIGFGISRVRLG